MKARATLHLFLVLFLGLVCGLVMVGCGGGSNGTSQFEPNTFSGQTTTTSPSLSPSPSSSLTMSPSPSGTNNSSPSPSGSVSPSPTPTPSPTPVLHQFVFVATGQANTGIETFTVDKDGNVAQAASNFNTLIPDGSGGNLAPLGIAVSSDQTFAIVTTANGLSYCTVDAVTGQLNAVAPVINAGANVPSGPVALNGSSNAGVYADNTTHLVGFTVSGTGAIAFAAAATNNVYLANSLAMTNVGGQDVALAAPGLVLGDFAAYSLDAASGTLSDQSGGANHVNNFGGFALAVSGVAGQAMGAVNGAGAGPSVLGMAVTNTNQITYASNGALDAGNQISISAALLTGGTLPVALVTNDGTNGTFNAALFSFAADGTPTSIGNGSAVSAATATLSSVLLNPTQAVMTGSGAVPVGLVTTAGLLTPFAINTANPNALSSGSLTTAIVDGPAVCPNNIGVTSVFQ
jgi:hypothetical protein